MEVVKAVVMVPREMRTPPSITTGWKPKRLDSTDARGAVDELKGVGFADIRVGVEKLNLRLSIYCSRLDLISNPHTPTARALHQW